MKVGSHSVADELSNYPKVLGTCVALDRPTDVVHLGAIPDGSDAFHHGDIGLGYQVPRVLVDIADEERAAVVAMYSVDVDRHIDVDDVAVLERTGIGDAMANNLVHRGADRLWKASVVQRRWVGATTNRLVVNDLIDLVGSDSRRHETTSMDQYLCGHGSCLTHRIELVGGSHEARKRWPWVPGIGVRRLSDRAGDRPTQADNSRPNRRIGYRCGICVAFTFALSHSPSAYRRSPRRPAAMNRRRRRMGTHHGAA